MIDYVFAFADEATAQIDPQLSAYWTAEGGWRGDMCIPNLRVTVNGTGTPITVTLQDGSTMPSMSPDVLLDAYWRIAIGLPTRDAALELSTGLEIVADRSLALSGAPLSEYIIHSSVPLANLAAISVSPIFAGANYL